MRMSHKKYGNTKSLVKMVTKNKIMDLEKKIATTNLQKISRK